MSKRILILSVTVGNGHMRAAEALKKAAVLRDPATEVIILDTFRYASPLLEKVVLGTYLEILKMSPAIYKYLYRQSEQGQSLSGWGKTEFNRIVSLLTAPKLIRLIKEFQPDAVVCTHPFPVGVITHIRRKGHYNGPIYAAITDFTIHSFWVFPGVDCYFVGDESLLPECAAYEIPASRVQATGIPIDPVFAETYDPGELKAEFGLNPELPVLFLTGGGLGMGNLESSVRALCESIGDCQLLVIAGSNEKLQEQLKQLAPQMPCPVQVYGFVNDIQRYMAAADLFIGKPGGLSCAEAMALGLPILMVDPLPGQEERNSQFIVGMGAGWQVSREDLPEAAQKCLANTELLTTMTEAAVAIGKPHAARDATEVLLCR
jgi:processive 1,2-diacylglycerol beta-glucosyltransferase